MLREYATFLKTQRLKEAAAVQLRATIELNAPLMKRFADMPRDMLTQNFEQSFAEFATALEEGRGERRAAETLRLWASGELPNIPKEAVEPTDMVLVYAAQRTALLSFVKDYTQDVETAMALVDEIEAFFTRVQAMAVEQFDRMRRETARELAREKALFERLVTSVPAGVAYFDRNLVYQWANPALARMLGMSLDQMVGRPIAEVVAGEDSKLIVVLKQVLSTGQPYRATARPLVYELNGETRTTYWDVVCEPLFNEEGMVEGILSLSLEVSERVERDRLQQEKIKALEEADTLKDQFLSILSHELRTPINAITGFGSILDDEVIGPLTPQQHAYLRKMLGGADVLLSLINDLLDMSRIQAGRFSLSPEPMSLAETAGEALESLASLAEQKGLTIHTEFPPDLPTLNADPQRVRQVLTNLVGNAIKFTPAGGSIRVSARTEQDPQTGTPHAVKVDVTDTGVGIAPENLPKLFQPFTQLDMSSTRGASGTGLGLSISKALITAHGGDIGAQSPGLGCGSSFWFTLPMRP